MLTDQQKLFWDENGYLILPGFFAEQATDSVANLHRRLWEECPADVVVDVLDTNRRFRMSELYAESKKPRCKVNDLFLNYEEVRRLSLDERLLEIIDELLPDAPVLCNTLSLDYGTQQPLHIDSLYMTPQTDNHLAATWMALEDCHPDAGPLCYIPGSHKIPIYRFSTGSPHSVAEEMPLWEEYIQQKIQEYGLKEEIFLPKKGDVFLWHAQLIHGGTPSKNPNLTRKSLVSHYFTKSDCVKLKAKLVPTGCGYWMKRSPQGVAESENSGDRPPEKIPGSRVERFLRTTLHYLRLWKRDVFNL
ncbi:MAG: phytanoyl-CoA dioxygenase family protein [Oscillatoria princeps RMCB-10]|jgi:ectoine hydroxylase-related dioxygenase (phytanoyl-CoA dioxygenase family)|nr:phytanoyl-CoA dioxygenase family protein [Oscillatoria princeps RMCB-10]